MSYERFWELDALRGSALALMIGYHFVFDLNYFGVARISLPQLVPRAIGALFLLLVGVSLSVSYARSSQLSGKALLFKQLKRSASLLGVALLITVATFVYPRHGFIVFGVMHLIAVSVLLSLAFKDFRLFNLFLGAALILAGLAASAVTVKTPFLVWLGVAFPGFYTLDYYPVLPWFGVVLIGMFVGKLFYPGAKRAFGVPKPRFALLQLAGRNSLAVYLLHQPILVGLILASKLAGIIK